MAESGPKMHDVFLCYAHADRPVVHALSTRLEADGVRCFVDTVSILPGAAVYDSIRAALSLCQSLVVLLSKATEWSDWPQRELNVFWSNHRRVIPLRLDPHAPVPALLASAKFLDWHPEVVRETNYAILLGALTSPTTRGPSPPRPAPMSAAALTHQWKPTLTAMAGYIERGAVQAQLDAHLWPSSGPATLIAVSGMGGGTGKSTLARTVIQRCSDRFTRGWVLDGSSRAALLASLAVADETTAGSRAGQPGSGWLALVENVDDGALALNLLRLLPKVGGCIVVTSRFADWDREGWAMVHVGVMSADEAAAMLGPGSDAVAMALGFLPQALGCARAYAACTKIAWTAYMSMLATVATQAAATTMVVQAGEPAFLAAALRASVLGALAAVPSARILVQVLQLLHPFCAARSLVAAAFIKAARTLDAEQPIAALALFSVITALETTVTLQPLMLETIRTCVPCELHVAVALSKVMNDVAYAETPTPPPVSLRHMLLHYDNLLAWMGRECPVALERADALQACAYLWAERFGEPGKAVPLYEAALAIRERHSGPDHAEMAEALTNLGNAYGALGESGKQKALLERALVIFDKHYGEDHIMSAPTLTNLGNVYGALSDLAKQAAFLERALAIKERHYGPAHASVAVTLTNLGNAYGDLGDYAKQKALLERALAIDERHHGPDHIVVAITLTNLGNAYGALGNAATQKALLERALAIEERHYGPDHAQVAIALTNLGNAYGALGGDPAKQKALLERALAIKERHYGPDHVSVARTLVSLSNTYGALGDAAKQTALLERALAIEERHYGPDHIQVAITVFNLGNAHRALGNLKEARRCMERCLAMETAYYGPDHRNTKFTVAAIARLPQG